MTGDIDDVELEVASPKKKKDISRNSAFRPSKSIEMNRSHVMKRSRNHDSAFLSIISPPRTGENQQNSSGQLNMSRLSNVSVSYQSREGIQRVREKVYGKRGVQMTKESKEAASASIAPEEQRKSILARRSSQIEK